VEVEVADTECGHFADAQAALETEFHHEPVAEAEESTGWVHGN